MVNKPSTWLCPLCGLVEVPYGKGCEGGLTCPNREHAHITGRFYIEREKGNNVRPFSEAASIGISKVSDE